MPVTLQTPINSSIANGVTTVFPYQWLIPSADAIAVEVNGVIVTTGFTVSGVGNPAGGNIIFAVAPANGSSIVRYRDLDAKREFDWTEGGDLLAATHDANDDYAIMLIQQLLEALSRTPKLARGSALAGLITLPAPGASQYLRYNVAGNNLEVAAAVVDIGNFLQSGVGAKLRSANSKMGDFLTLYDFENIDPTGATSSYLGIRRAWEAAAANNRILMIPPGAWMYDEQLVFDQQVDVLGMSDQFSELRKKGDFLGIVIEGGAQSMRFGNLNLSNVDDPSSTSGTLKIINGANADVHRLYIHDAGGIAIEVDDNGVDVGTGTTVCLHIRDCQMSLCREGLVFTEAYGSMISNCGSNGHLVGWGMRAELAHFCTVLGVYCHVNVGGGNYLNNVIQGTWELYGESSTGEDNHITANCQKNRITIKGSTKPPLVLNHDNEIFDYAYLNALRIAAISAGPRYTNAIGVDLNASAGGGGAGAVGVQGGNGNLNGGDAGGTAGAAPGGGAHVTGGAPVNGSIYGPARLNPGNDGGVVVGGLINSYPPNRSVSLHHASTTQLPTLPMLTTVQRDALVTKSDRMGPFLHSNDGGATGTVEVRIGGAWVVL